MSSFFLSFSFKFNCIGARFYIKFRGFLCCYVKEISMKLLAACLLFVFSTASFATPIDGKIFYVVPSGELVDIDVTLEVPTRGEGEVVLSGNNFEWRTTNFKSFTKNGKKVFLAAFQTEFRNVKSTILFKGTYRKARTRFYTMETCTRKRSR